MDGGALALWNKWATQILVVLSFSLQVVLLLLAGIRRREANPVLRLLLWLAYQLADSTAIYTIGHLSLISSTAVEHQLVAFWAPFLLLHLGGPDNITAYALEDNQLWLRHLLTLVVQVLGAAYVLYKHIAFAGSGDMLLVAAVLVFVVGSIKYGERTWALWCANFSSIDSSLKKHPRDKLGPFYPEPDVSEGLELNDEFLLYRAHSQFHVCKRGIVDSVIELEPGESRDDRIIVDLEHRHMWTMIEMELSLMYDILYTKAVVISTWFGYCVRVFSPLAIAAAFLLFQFNGSKDGYNRIDVAITYTLLGGALLLEASSLLDAVGSSWALTFLSGTRWAWLRHEALCYGRWYQLHRAVVSLHRFVGFTSSSSYIKSRRWSGTMGQYNMLHFCCRDEESTSYYRPLLGRLAKLLGYQEWWRKKHYSGAVVISAVLKKVLFRSLHGLFVQQNEVNTMGILRKKWGQQALEKWGLHDILRSELGVELHEGIIVWHLATDILLARINEDSKREDKDLVEVIRVLSNYMMFLLVRRPYLLPGLAQNWLYQQTCNNLEKIWHDNKSSPISSHGFARINELFHLYDSPDSSALPQIEMLAMILFLDEPGYSRERPRLSYSYTIVEVLESKPGKIVNPLVVLLDVWANILVYAANRCSRESHAKKLNSGVELTTIVWLMAEHLHQLSLGQKQGV
uniref:DUF4220 domain-containing protein n=1 Tax=Oryza rufipogon TaxID=4529 RepID=A0A0E0QI74_ORYRU